jgi:hypothetical protein
MRVVQWLAWASLAAASVPAAAAGEQQIPTSAFAARSPFSTLPLLSPSGSRIAFAVADEKHQGLSVVDADTGKTVSNFPLQAGQELQWLRWAGEGRLLLSLSLPLDLYGYPVRVTRLFVVELATGAASFVGRKSQSLDGDNVIFVDPAGQFLLQSMQPDPWSEPEVWRFRLDGSDSKGERVERRSGVLQWIADDEGVVRVGTGSGKPQAQDLLPQGSRFGSRGGRARRRQRRR